MLPTEPQQPLRRRQHDLGTVYKISNVEELLVIQRERENSRRLIDMAIRCIAKQHLCQKTRTRSTILRTVDPKYRYGMGAKR